MARSTASKTAERERRQQGEGLAQEPAGRPTPFGSHGDIVGLQRAAGNRAVDGLLGGTQRQVPPIVDEVLRSGTGQPLDTATREFMGSRFGEDFSQVRVHTDARAAESAQAINAQAYTAGRDVVFGTGQYAPATPKGRWVLAHELAHVVQQNAAGAQTRPEVSQAGDPFERSADAAAQHLTSHSQMDGHASSVLGRSVASAGHSMPPAIQRLSTERRQRDDRDVLEAELTETLYGQPQYFETGLLIHHARLLHSKSQSAGSLTRAAAARSLVGFYQILREREETASRDAEGALLRSYLGDLVPWTEEKPRSLNDIAPFSPRNVLQWFASAADWPQPRTAGSGGKPGSLSKPPPFLEKPAEALTRIGATVEDQPLSDYELSSGKTGGGTAWRLRPTSRVELVTGRCDLFLQQVRHHGHHVSGRNRRPPSRRWRSVCCRRATGSIDA